MTIARRPRIQTASDLCRDCQACTLGCSLYHHGECSLELARLVVSKDMACYEFAIRICQHCEIPDCQAACPSEAITLDERGVALLDDGLCVRCGACVDACPHGAIFHNGARDLYLKCDLCAGRDQGPLCVELCPVEALLLA